MVDTIGPRLEGVVGAFLLLTWIFTGLRTYVRLFVSKGWGLDDSLLIASLLCFTMFCSFALAGIPLGFGRHPDDIPLKNISRGMLFWWLFQIFFTLTTALLRISIAIFILRLCQKPIYKFIVHVTTAVVIAFSIFYLGLLIFQCHPVSLFWTHWSVTRPTAASGACLDLKILVVASYAQCAISAMADWVLGILPLWLIWNLQMNLRTKLSVGVLLGFGLVAGIIAITRVPFILELPNGNFFYTAVDMAIWATVEPGLGIIATAACVLRPLVKSFLSSTSYGNYRSRDTTTHHHTWRNENDSVDRINITRNHHIRMNNMEIDGVVTSVRTSYRRETVKDWRRNHSSAQMPQIGNRSQEELTGDSGNAILVHSELQIKTQKNGEEQKREESIESLDSVL